MNNLLDEKGFVFIDDSSRPYWCRMWGGHPWFFYWNEGPKGWVSLRVVSQSDIWLAQQKQISDEQAQLYHDLHNQTFGGAPEKLNKN
jgi:hypothetical protein